MIQVSKRYALAIGVLALAAAGPVWLYGQGYLDRDDCADPAALAAFFGTEQPAPADGAGVDPPGVIQRIAGEVDPGASGGLPLRFAILRSTDPTRIAGRPYQYVFGQLEVVQRQLRWVKDADGRRLPIEWTFGHVGQQARFASYAFAYEGRAVVHPTRALLASTGRRLLGGGLPLTLLVVGGRISLDQVDEARAAADAWLLTAWSHYLQACHP